MSRDKVLLSWHAYNNDPYVRDGEALNEDGSRIPGPTLSLLYDDASEYKGKIRKVIMLVAKTGDRARDLETAKRALASEEAVRAGGNVEVHRVQVEVTSVVDHASLHASLTSLLGRFRTIAGSDELVVNISPGTPAMATIWVLLAATGALDEPYVVVQGVDRRFRRGGPATKQVDLVLDTYLRQFKETDVAGVTEPAAAVGLRLDSMESPSYQVLREEAKLYAPLLVPVLVTGPRGSGKTTIARWLRASGPRKRGRRKNPWPILNCGMFSPDLIRSELFGHVKGSFSGAVADKVGLLKQLDGDTVFLDEIGDLGRPEQRALIRAVEEGVFMPVGGSETVESRFRLVTATNLPEAELRERLDPDFFDRISHFRLRMPALCDVREDLPALWEQVWTSVEKPAGIADLSESGRHTLVAGLGGHPLPGNFRDLQRVAYQLVARLHQKHPELEAVHESLATGLSSGMRYEDFNGGVPAVVQAYAAGGSLDDVYQTEGRIAVGPAVEGLKMFVATESQRIGRRDGKSAEDVCDMKLRTIQKWAKHDRG